MKKEFNGLQNLIDGEISDLAHFNFSELELIEEDKDFKFWDATIEIDDKIKTLCFKTDRYVSIFINVGEDYKRIHSEDKSIKHFWIALLSN